MNLLWIRTFLLNSRAVQIWVLKQKFFVDIFTIGSGSVDPHILADPEPGSHNVADPTDPDPKNWKLA